MSGDLSCAVGVARHHNFPPRLQLRRTLDCGGRKRFPHPCRVLRILFRARVPHKATRPMSAAAVIARVTEAEMLIAERFEGAREPTLRDAIPVHGSEEIVSSACSRFIGHLPAPSAACHHSI